jgi:tripartite-type tricarboxylate transporter receptor subunit TctC
VEPGHGGNTHPARTTADHRCTLPFFDNLQPPGNMQAFSSCSGMITDVAGQVTMIFQRYGSGEVFVKGDMALLR